MAVAGEEGLHRLSSAWADLPADRGGEPFVVAYAAIEKSRDPEDADRQTAPDLLARAEDEDVLGISVGGSRDIVGRAVVEGAGPRGDVVQPAVVATLHTSSADDLDAHFDDFGRAGLHPLGLSVYAARWA